MGYGEGTSPIIFENLVILQVDTEMGEGSYIIAFDRVTGKQAWKTARKNRSSWSTPVLVRGSKRVELIASGAESVKSYDPATGKELWRLGRSSKITAPTPIFADDMLVVVSGRGPERPIFVVKAGARGLLN